MIDKIMTKQKQMGKFSIQNSIFFLNLRFVATAGDESHREINCFAQQGNGIQTTRCTGLILKPERIIEQHFFV